MQSIAASNPRPARCCGPVYLASRSTRGVWIGAGGLVALGRGARRYGPQRRRLTRTCRPAILAQINLTELAPARTGLTALSLKRFRTRHQFAANGHVAGFGDEVTAESVDFLGDVADVELAADCGAHIIQVGAAIGQKRAVGLPNDPRALLLVVFVGDVPDDQFHQILD